LPAWDLIFTDILVPIQRNRPSAPEKHGGLCPAQSHQLADLARINFACTSSLFINKYSVGKYAALISGQWKQGVPIDLFIRQLVHAGQLQAHVTSPS